MIDAELRYACRACENWTLHEEPPGSYAWCPVCDWTDRSLDTADDEYALLRARTSVAENGCSDASSPAKLRAPTPQELNKVGAVELQRDLDVRDANRGRITTQIRDAFENVSARSRISLHDALRRELGDVEGFVSWSGEDTTWSEIPDDVLDRYASRGSQMFSYWDDWSFLYYLPPYMIRGLHGFPRVALFALSTVTTSGNVAGMKTRKASLFSGGQQEAVRAFLHYVEVYGPFHEDAKELVQRWGTVRTRSRADAVGGRAVGVWVVGGAGRWSTKPNDTAPKKFGFYETVVPDPTSRDNAYLHSALLHDGLGGNGLNPMSQLRAYLVQVDPHNPDLFLGKAYFALGPVRIPLIYFILERIRRGLTDMLRGDAMDGPGRARRVWVVSVVASA